MVSEKIIIQEHTKVFECNKQVKISMTTVVTYEKDFGDGAYYKIVCSMMRQEAHTSI